ncbi:AraC family transcriptional regulator [Nibricoccus aquaticus]|uniref:AraC family transcriptional regulator n=1 Tax=Nibricoccus aquaticus TaxID=2576891 RepID=A0A290QF43_9BACT|nr:DJ-1/PfpI family protein [Nibricoccus aquaticus]ATC62971.1 AraC family transcriptional regulator [Nibricoccus aquaticus]
MKKHVAILIFDDVEILDFAGPFEVFAVTDELRAHETFHVFTVAEQRATIRARNGLKIVPDFLLENCPAAQVLVIPGGKGARALLNRPLLMEWVRKQARGAEIVMSVCTGALVLGKAGLLDGLRATTHHACFEELRAVVPTAVIEAGVRFTDNGKVCTSAGIAAGIDLSLHVVGRLLGQEVADTTARYMDYERHA